MNELLRKTEQDHTQGRIRNFFVKIKKYKQFKSNQKTVRDTDDKILVPILKQKQSGKTYHENRSRRLAVNARQTDKMLNGRVKTEIYY